MPNRHITANSFAENESSVFQSGNFSAKYIRNSTSRRDIRPAENVSNSSTGLANIQPVTISGGFTTSKMPEVDESSQLGVSLKKSPSDNRRESLLSSSISQSTSTLPRVPPRSSGTIESRQSQPNMNQLLSNEENSLPDQSRLQQSAPIMSMSSSNTAIEPAGTNYSSLKTPGGFITREIEPWVTDKINDSFSHTGLQPLRKVVSSDSLKTKSRRSTISNIGGNESVRELIAPGAFRRNFIIQNKKQGLRNSNNIVTKNFLEFLDLYGHFAGEDLIDEEESETEYEDTEDEESRVGNNNVFEDEDTEQYFENVRNMRNNKQVIKSRHKAKLSSKKTSTLKAFLLLLKAFLGTGIIFLPKAFANGGLLFSILMILSFSLVSYYCFIILIKTTSKCKVSGYGDLGHKLFGKKMQFIILLSLTLSQLGFASTYVVFISKNFQEILEELYHFKLELSGFILLQLLIFLPVSLTRSISKLGFFALIADLFIFLGLIYIYLQSGLKFIHDGISPDISMFKKDSWSLFIGTAVFTYEGIGLLIPIQESMKEPEKFNRLLVLVMTIVTLVFISIASLSYLSFGEDTHTIILMNFPMNSLTLTIQLLYAIAILLSTPLQLFPAIKIVESYLFNKNRKTWRDKIRRNSEAISIFSDGGGSNDVNSLRAPDFTPLLPSISNSGNYDSVTPNLNLVNEDGLISGKSDNFIKILKNIGRVVMVLVMCGIGYLGSENLDKFVSLIGSITCVPLIYIYPPLLYGREFGQNLHWTERLLSTLVFIAGCILMGYTTYETVIHF